MSLRFLEEQKKGIGIKLTPDSTGQMKLERYSLGDTEELDEDLDGFEIYPKKKTVLIFDHSLFKLFYQN